MERSKQAEECLCAVMVGGGIATFSATVLLLFTPLLDSDWPDYHESKIRMTFCHPDTGLVAWPSAAGILLGVGSSAIGGVLPFLRKPLDVDTGGEKRRNSV
jgi:hypothetical protein